MKSILTKVVLAVVLLSLLLSCRPSENSENLKANSAAPPATPATPTPTSESSKPGVNGNASASTGNDMAAVQSELDEAKRAVLRSTLNGISQEAAPMLTDDYKNVRPDGTVENKSQYLARLKPLKGLDTFFVSELKVKSLQGDTAVVTGLLQVRANGQDFRSKFNETFIRREGKWLLQSSENTELEKDH